MVKTFCMLLKTSFPSYLQWISITSISKWGKAIKPFVYAKCPESSTRQLPPEVSVGLASSNCSEEVWVIPEPTHSREGSPRLEMELPCIVVIRSAGETGECGVGHAGERGLRVRRPSSLFLLLLPLTPFARQPDFSVVCSDEMEGRKHLPDSRLSLLLSQPPRGPAAGLEVEAVLGDGGGGYHHCVQ